MKQYEAVILTLERLGGQATLANLYREVMTVKDCKWGTKTPFASIRRIVQIRPEIFRVRPGLWALRSYQKKLGLPDDQTTADLTPALAQQGHAYYQGLIAEIGRLRGLSTFIPNQDKNRPFLTTTLGALRTLQKVPHFSYETLMKRAATIDVTWFNERLMPHSLFEVEHTTDIQGSLIKFSELQDFNARMVIVADPHRKAEFEQKRNLTALREIRQRVAFYDYETLAKDHAGEAERAARAATAFVI